MAEEFNPIEKRMETIMTVIDAAIMSTNNAQDQLMLACAMLQRTKEIFDAVIGENGRKEMFKGMLDDK